MGYIIVDNDVITYIWVIDDIPTAVTEEEYMARYQKEKEKSDKAKGYDIITGVSE